DPEPTEGLRLFERELNAFLKRTFGVMQAADLFPPNVGHLDHDLAHRRRLNTLQGSEEIRSFHADRLERLRGDLGAIEVDGGEMSAERLDRGLSGQGGQIGTDETVRGTGQFLHFDVLRQRHTPRVDRKHLPATLVVRDSDDDLSIEASRPAEGLVYGI